MTEVSFNQTASTIQSVWASAQMGFDAAKAAFEAAPGDANDDAMELYCTARDNLMAAPAADFDGLKLKLDILQTLHVDGVAIPQDVKAVIADIRQLTAH